MKLRAIFFSLLLALAAAVSAAFVADEPGPYPLCYPPSFGGRFSIPADNPLTREGVELGRRLFYEPCLSSTKTISCASCHEQARAFTDGRAFSVGVSGKPTRRNAMSLANLLWVQRLFWDGRANGLEEQALVPLHHPDEMGLKPGEAAKALQPIAPYPALFRRAFGSDTVTDARIAQALAQFERTLISAHSRYDEYLAGRYALSAAEARGLRLFNAAPGPERGVRGGNCAHCHGGPKLMQEVFHNNGLDQRPTDAGRQEITGLALDAGRFRAPTLRNVALTAPYMHDGRLPTLESVLDHYSDHVRPSPTLSSELTVGENAKPGLRLTANEKADLVAFLRLLTDSAFVTNPAFADPRLRVSAAKK